MARWAPDAQGRLVRAAMELYGERGFEQTTVVDIAERAGVTERTFFRYFADKREVLFDSSNALQELIVAAVRAAPGSTTALDAIRAGMTAGSSLLEERREFNRLRSAVIAADMGLQERELFKMAALAAAAAALRDRGVPQPQASLSAETGVAAFRIAFEQWIGDAQARPLAGAIDTTFDALTLMADATHHPAAPLEV